MQLKDLESYGKIAGMIWAGAGFVATLLVAAEKPSTVSHLAIYLLSQSKVEILSLLLCYLAYRTIKWVIPQIRKKSKTIASKFWITTFSLLSGIMLLASIITAYFLVQIRYEFWTQVAKKAYVQKYSNRIDALAESGRITDSYRLAEEVQKNLNGSAESHYLDRRLQTLAGLTSRSDKLSRSTSGGAWNPITQRQAYFELVEAVRLNPQNYEAADRLKSTLSTLKKDFQLDAKGICASDGHLSTFNGYATSGLEAHIRWLENKSDCTKIETRLNEAWKVQDMLAILKISDDTRQPLSKWQENWRSGIR